MKFRTEYNPEVAGRLLDPLMPVVLVGSCFTDSIGARMRVCRWPSLANPCGVLYNPASIANILSLSADDDEKKVLAAVKRSIVSRDGLFLSWLTDSKTCGTSEAETADTLIGKLSEIKEALAVAGVLIVTFGTSWIYELSDSPGYIVSNCHKFPSKDFKRRRLSVDEIPRRLSHSLFSPFLKEVRTLSSRSYSCSTGLPRYWSSSRRPAS